MTMSFSQAILAGLQLRGLLLKDVKKSPRFLFPHSMRYPRVAVSLRLLN